MLLFTRGECHEILGVLSHGCVANRKAEAADRGEFIFSSVVQAAMPNTQYCGYHAGVSYYQLTKD